MHVIAGYSRHPGCLRVQDQSRRFRILGRWRNRIGRILPNPPPAVQRLAHLGGGFRGSGRRSREQEPSVKPELLGRREAQKEEVPPEIVGPHPVVLALQAVPPLERKPPQEAVRELDPCRVGSEVHGIV